MKPLLYSLLNPLHLCGASVLLYCSYLALRPTHLDLSGFSIEHLSPVVCFNLGVFGILSGYHILRQSHFSQKTKFIVSHMGLRFLSQRL